MSRIRYLGEGQRIAVGIRSCHLTAHWGILCRGLRIVVRHWGVVHRRYRNGYRGLCFASLAIGHLYGEAVAAAVVRRRGIGVAAVSIHHNRPVGWIAPLGVGQPIAVGISCCHLTTHWGILCRSLRIVARHWGIVYRGYRDGYRGDVRVLRAVVSPVGEGVRAIVVRGRRISKGAVSVEYQGAVSRIRYLGEGQRIAVGIRSCHLTAHWGILCRGLRIVARHWGIVNGGYRDGHRGHCFASLAIGYLYGEAVAAAVVRRWGIGVAAVSIYHNRAVGGVASLAVGQRIAVGIRSCHLTAHWGILCRGLRIVARHWGIVYRGYRDGYRGLCFASLAIGYLYGEAVAAAIVRRWGIGVAAVSIYHNRAVGGVASLAVGQRIAVGIRSSKFAINRRILCRGLHIVIRHWGVVHRGYRDGYRGHIRVGCSVVRPVGEAIRSAVVRCRDVGKRSISIEG